MITIAGAGIAGLSTAYEIQKRGQKVRVYEASSKLGANACSRFAGGMLAPFCEGESCEPDVVAMGKRAQSWWRDITPVTQRGTLVLAHNRDRTDLMQFARLTQQHQTLDQSGVHALEPTLAERFTTGLYFATESHLDPQQALLDLAVKFQHLGGEIHLNTQAPENVDLICTGMQSDLPELRPVRGEMVVLHAPDVKISRTIRLMHPRHPIYLVPRRNDHYMIGATMIESSAKTPVSLRSLMELLNTAFSLHPAFAEASIVETGAGLRPAFPDNRPQLRMHNGKLHLNGFYRHGFLLAPVMAAKAADKLLGGIK